GPGAGRLPGVESVLAQLMEEHRQGVHPDKCSSWRDSEAETWLHFDSLNGEQELKSSAALEGQVGMISLSPE
ncbi:hypothetical protein AMECASPLE_005995, partial [Ameca splendens]